ncbi:MAG: hydrolase [Alphaproteobacteria bacterium]
MKAGARVWQRMVSGRRLDLLEPAPLDVEITDIAHGLARVARWNGQTSGEHAFSVAQHCLLVEALFARLRPSASSPDRLAALLHDGAEYVIGDMISPFKAVIGSGYKDVEARILGAIHLRFGLPQSLPLRLASQIKKADSIAAFHEATALAGFSPAEAKRYFGTPKADDLAADPAIADLLDPKPAAIVERQFLDRFNSLHDAD